MHWKSVVVALDRGLERLYRVCGYLAAAFLVLMAALVVTSIVSRVLGIYVRGTVEYSGYSMAAASFLALAYTFRAGGHIRVGVILTRLRGAPRFLLEIWCLVTASAVVCFVAIYLVRLTWYSWRFEERSEGTDAILIWLPQSLMASGAVVFATCVVHLTVRALVKGRVAVSNPE